MIDAEEFRQHLAIDKMALDDELIKQPQMYNTIGEAWAEAVAERDTLKEQAATIDAKLDAAVRETFDKNEKKYTEAMVKNAVQTDKKHEAAFNAYNRAKLHADKLWALKAAFEQRANMLEFLCKLYSNNYYVRDSVRPAAEEVRYAARRKQMRSQE